MLQKMLGGAVNNVQLEDPLIFDSPTRKSKILTYAIEEVEAKKFVFYPAITTYPQAL